MDLDRFSHSRMILLSKQQGFIENIYISALSKIYLAV